jgi:DNA/RNA endonuclease YhcR with UshA esterase domain
MKTRLLAVVAAVVAALVFSGPMFAHHGTAAYDTGNPVTVKGTVTDFRFINPHCQVYFDIKNDKGEVEHWQGELTAPNKLARAGWTKHSLTPGDQINVTGLVGKYGGHSIWIRKLIGPDGQPMQLSED